MTGVSKDAQRYAASCLFAYAIGSDVVKERIKNILVGIYMREGGKITDEQDAKDLDRLDEVLFADK